MVAVLERRVQRRARSGAVQHVRVHRAIELLERVGEAFVVAAGIAGESCRLAVEQGRVAQQLAVGLAAFADPERVRRLAVPGERLSLRRRSRSAGSSSAQPSPATRSTRRARRPRTAAGSTP